MLEEGTALADTDSSDVSTTKDSRTHLTEATPPRTSDQRQAYQLDAVVDSDGHCMSLVLCNSLEANWRMSHPSWTTAQRCSECR